MTTLGWSALGSLAAKLLEQSASLSEMLTYMHVAVGVSGAVAALLAISEFKRQVEARDRHRILDTSAEQCRALASQARFAESRDRLLGLAERLG